MLKKIVYIVVVLPIAVALIALSVANRGDVRLALNPFQPDDTVLSITGPFFVFLFAALMVGIFIGGVATWLTQGRHRKKARERQYEAAKWHIEADRQRERANDLARQQTSTGLART